MTQFRIPFLTVVALAATAMLGVSAMQPEAPININTATAEELTALDGVGEVIAGRIVEWREKNGPFTNTDELTNIEGIGETTYQNIRPHVTVGDADQRKGRGASPEDAFPRTA